MPGSPWDNRFVRSIATAGAALMLLGASAFAQTPPSAREYALILYGYTLFPVFVALHCDNTVVRDNAAMEPAVKRWHTRQSAYFDKITDVIDGTGGLPERAAELSQQVAKSAAEKDVAKQADQPAYCRDFPRRLESGEFDLDKAPNMAPLLQHLMAGP